MKNTFSSKQIIELNEFNSGLLAQKVGSVELKVDSVFTCELENDIICEAKKLKFNLISLKTNSPIKSLNFNFVGKIVNLEGNISEVEKNLVRFKNKYPLNIIFINEISEIEHLFEYSAPTRFNNDFNINKKTSIDLKRKILNYYLDNHKHYFLGYKNKKNELVGFHNAFSLNNTLNLYEINIMPAYRNGFISSAFIYKNIENMKIYNKGSEKVATKIYETNKNSIDFFKKIGLNDEVLVEYHYHLWLNF